MNKIITVYELLELIKDGKAPRKIIYDNKKYFIEVHDYSLNGEKVFWLFEDNNIIEIMTKKVEILEEDKPIIERLNLDGEPLKEKEIPRAIDYLLEGRISEIIDYINKKEGKQWYSK